MRRTVKILIIAVVAAVGGCAGGWYSRTPLANDQPTVPVPNRVEFNVNLARVSYLPPTLVANRPARPPERFGDPTVSRIEFEGKWFWLVDLHRGDGVPYKSIGLYAPTDAGNCSLVLEAESCGAGWLKPESDAATGVLVLREHARSYLEGTSSCRAISDRSELTGRCTVSNARRSGEHICR